MTDDSPPHGTKNTAQLFGGPWSVVKIEIIEKYLRAYTAALKKQAFKLTYIDAFAGSGLFSFDDEEFPLFLDSDAAKQEHEGSARRALAVTPPFDEIIFIDESAANVAALNGIIGGRPGALAKRGDANVIVSGLCDPQDWRPKGRRGVIFLDPFGLNVNWATLEAIRRSTVLDVWYLFSLCGLYRNAPLSFARLTPDKIAAVARALGELDWPDRFYAAQPALSAGPDLFGAVAPLGGKSRFLDVNAMEAYVMRRLSSLFPRVLRPRRFHGPTGAPLFSLFFAMANPDAPAVALATKIAQHILKTT